MTLAYIITEADGAKSILEKLLPKSIIEETKLVASSGKSSAESLASTLLNVKLLPVVLVLNADTDNEQLIREQSELVNYLLRRGSPGIPFKVFLAVPEIEAVFIHDRSLIEKMIGRSLIDVEWELAKLRPKKFLEGGFGTPAILSKIFEYLSEEDIHTLQQHALLKGIIDFLSLNSPTPIALARNPVS